MVSSTVGLLAAILDAILDLTAFQYSDFGRLLVCYSPPETVPETVEKPFLAIFGGSTLFLPDYSSSSIVQSQQYKSAQKTGGINLRPNTPVEPSNIRRMSEDAEYSMCD